MYQIEVKIPFRAGHRLIEPYEGKCNNVHGEGYTAICFFEGETLNPCGMVIDFKQAKILVKEWIDNNWDHAYLYKAGDKVGEFLRKLNLRVFEFEHNPTAEYMAEYLYFLLDTFNLPIKKVGIIESFEDSIAWFEE
jgi:6-pyruvoyltetrahydropterin/6-carboxytetrahydropterin synthase